MSLFNHHFQFLSNGNSAPLQAYNNGIREQILGGAAFDRAKKEITSWQGYAKTPLVALDGLAKALNVKSLYYKDEGTRFGLGSFKALGGAYAVLRLLQGEIEQQTGHIPSSVDITDGKFRPIVSSITVCCATDGNHGRSVSWGAGVFGCRCIIYVHETVSAERREAIAGYGAEVRVVPGNYDDAVRKAASDAAANGWHVVSDTSYEGYTNVPRNVMQGYTVMAEESAQQIPEKPTHIFIQGGVGGLAAAVCSYFWEAGGADRPKLILVEPDKAACLYSSAVEGKPTAVHGALDTIMAGLACGEVSILAWQILAQGADAFLTIPDEAAADMMRCLAVSPYGDSPVIAGESAVAGIAGAVLVARDQKVRDALGIDSQSVFLFFGTEGATDAAVYRSIVGRSPEEIRAAA